MEQIGSFCICGCGKELHGSRVYFPGHRPKRVKKSPEERSRIAREMWDRRGRAKVELRPCACGCGTMVKGKWKHGHHSRVQNISQREDIREKRSEMFKRLWVEGKCKPWNRGLTKEDPRVAAYGKTHAANFSDEHRVIRSEGMKGQWLTGNIVALRGPQHSQWKGGTSGLTNRMRASHQLYALWKRPILERDKFTCQKEGPHSGDLVVHHNKELFAAILQKVLLRLYPDALDREISFDEGTKVLSAVVDYHVENEVSGLTLCEGCHEKLHSAS